MIIGGALAAAVMVAASLLTAAPSGDPERARVRTVASGLDNPRGLAFGPAGELYVAEAGSGGPAPCRPGSHGELRCFGRSGAITLLQGGRQRRVVRNLPSLALPSGAEAAGPRDVSVGPAGDLHYAVARDAVLPAYGISNGPSGSDPVALLTAGRGLLIVDAAAGALVRAGPKGRALTVARIPAPTSVALGPDGAVFVAQRSRIWRVEPGRAPRLHAAGFTGIVDLAWSGRELLVLEASGVLLRAGPGGVRRIASGLTAPGGLAVRDRHAYVTIHSTGRGVGEVVRIRLGPCGGAEPRVRRC